MKIKIKSDGTSYNTHVTNAETGEELEGVTKVVWTVDTKDGLAKLSLEVAGVEVDVEGETDA